MLQLVITKEEYTGIDTQFLCVSKYDPHRRTISDLLLINNMVPVAVTSTVDR
jgi:hypothetical protein